MTNKQKRSSSRRRNTPLKEVKSKKLKALIKMAAMQQSIQKKITTSKQIQKQNLAKYQWQAFFLTYILYICFYLARKPFSTIKDTLKTPNQLKSTPLTDDDLGQIETVFLVAYAGAQFIIGPFGDKYGARKLLFVALIGTSVACYMMSVAESLFDLRLAWGMNGIFQAAAFPLMMKALSPWYDNNTRAIMLGYWTTCQQIGGTVAVSLAGYIASGGFDRAWFGGSDGTTTWRDSFLLPAVVAGIAAVVTLTMMIEHPKDVGLKTPTDNSNKKHQKKNRSKKKMNLFEQVHGSNYWSGIPIGGDDRAITEGRYEEYEFKAPVTKERYEENVALSRKNRAALKARLASSKVAKNKTKTARRAPSKGRSSSSSTKFHEIQVPMKEIEIFLKMKVSDLKKELKKRDLQVSGKKADLLKRLLEGIAANGDDDDDDDAPVAAASTKPKRRRSKTPVKNTAVSKYLRTTTLVAGLRDHDKEPVVLRPRTRRSRR